MSQNEPKSIDIHRDIVRTEAFNSSMLPIVLPNAPGLWPDGWGRQSNESWAGLKYISRFRGSRLFDIAGLLARLRMGLHDYGPDESEEYCQPIG